MSVNFVDRVSTYPNRYKVTKEDGTTEYLTLERADEPTVVGTPLNAATFNRLVDHSDNKLSTELVWENASPASEFSGRTLDITVPSDATIGIITGSYADSAPSEFKKILRNRKSWIGLSGASVNIYRTIEVTSNGIVISDAKYSSVYAGASDSVNNKFLIPYKIYIVRGANL